MNNPYVKYEVEKNFADIVATEQVLVPNGGHINNELNKLMPLKLLECNKLENSYIQLKYKVKK